MSSKVTEAYVIGLLADVEQDAPRLTAELAAANQRAAAIDAELTNLLRRFDESRTVLHDARAAVSRRGAEINDGNMRIASLHQELASFKKKADDIKTEMDRVRDDRALRRKLRRGRAKITVQIEEREEEVESLRHKVATVRAELGAAESTATRERDRSRLLTLELDKLQGQLPSPYLYTRLFATLAARAHCHLFLDRDLPAWVEQMRTAIAWTVELHSELRAGKYRLDTNSELVGGRAMATAEAIYGAVALGDIEVAEQIFAMATDPALFFHQIFNVFRVWCLGLYLKGRTRELRELLRLHQFAQGLRGGYVQAFIGLLTEDERRFTVGIKDITRHEWELWQDPSLVRGAGVVNLGAAALCCLGRAAGIAVETPGATVPAMLITGAADRPRLRAR